MAKIRRGGFIFLTGISDHRPEHVHVFRDRRPVVKWDLENGLVMEGKMSGRIMKLIVKLQKEGKL